MLADNVKVCGHAESILCDCLTGIDVPRIVKEVMEPLGDKLQMMEQVSKGWLSLGGNEVEVQFTKPCEVEFSVSLKKE